MIISASYKTDIPAFYGQWFLNRLRAGYCMMRNPMNRRPIRVALTRNAVDGVVFWTKNFRPFMKVIDDFAAFKLPFIVQYTINGYPQSLENNVVDWERSIETAQTLRDRFGSRCVVWRYDTIVFSEQTPEDFHIENFARIADALRGVTDEVVISFMQLYRKTSRNMNSMATTNNNPWWDPSVNEKRELALRLHEIAAKRGITLSICSQPEIVSVQPASKCIDAGRLSDVIGSAIRARTLGNRPGCECAASRDIGDYDTCPHGCVYCYAVRSNELAIQRFRSHDPEGEYLFNDQPNIGFSSPLEQEVQGSLDI
jgi:hypothetical protein